MGRKMIYDILSVQRSLGTPGVFSGLMIARYVPTEQVRIIEYAE
jgi:hypothetical protein